MQTTRVHPPTVYSNAAVRKNVQRSLPHLAFFRCLAATGPYDAPRTLSLALGCTAVLQQKQHAQHPTHRPIHPRTHPVQHRSRTYSSSTWVCSCRRYLCCCIVLGFNIFSMLTLSPAVSGTRDGSFRRSPLVEVVVEAFTFADKDLVCAV